MDFDRTRRAGKRGDEVSERRAEKLRKEGWKDLPPGHERRANDPDGLWLGLPKSTAPAPDR